MPIHRTLVAFLVLAYSQVLISGCSIIRKSNSGSAVSPVTSVSNEDPARFDATPESVSELSLEAAKSMADAGHTREAILLYERAEQSHEEPQSLDEPLAALYSQAGQYQAAIERYQRLIAREGASSQRLNNLAWTQMEAGDFPSALRSVEQGLAIAPGNKRLLSSKAIIYFRQGDRDKSLEIFRQVYGPSAAHHNVATLAIEAGDEAAARYHFTQAMQFGEAAQVTRDMHQALLNP